MSKVEEKFIKELNKEYDIILGFQEYEKQIAELKQELAELKEMSNLIWMDLFHLNNDNNEWTKSLNKYKEEEAQAKLKEIQGND